ncbi:MAG: hypothetical protein KDA93_23435 [Planctomycetaceae bacterium]|nr:hypothetical protein [Planctomycetaceae bacterium]
MQPSNDFPIRLTVCETSDAARRLVGELQQAGFTTDEISIVCSQEACEQEFSEFVEQHPAGSQTSEALNKSGAAGLGLGTAAVLAGLLTTGGTAIMAVGALAGVAMAGTFTSVMMTRGAEKELADFYDQAITKGKILVAVETDDPVRQNQADKILGYDGRDATAIPKETLPSSETIS